MASLHDNRPITSRDSASIPSNTKWDDLVLLAGCPDASFKKTGKKRSLAKAVPEDSWFHHLPAVHASPDSEPEMLPTVLHINEVVH
ncbi:MAG TPA: hypothetical protein VE222_10775 [Nitrospiraceae bacterium]|nr:hypothetical protein [Nitrospiraceae bacterium]